jgi:hypothetical protein
LEKLKNNLKGRKATKAEAGLICRFRVFCDSLKLSEPLTTTLSCVMQPSSEGIKERGWAGSCGCWAEGAEVALRILIGGRAATDVFPLGNHLNHPRGSFGSATVLELRELLHEQTEDAGGRNSCEGADRGSFSRRGRAADSLLFRRRRRIQCKRSDPPRRDRSE